MIDTKVLIVGAGPAGTVCGSLMQKSGVDCLLIDHASFPRDKICGGGLTVKSWRKLKELLPDFRYDYHSVNHIRLMIDNKPACEFDTDQEIRIVKRREFDHELLKHYIQTGGRFLKDSPKEFAESAEGDIIVTLASGETVRCRYLIGADGSNSRVRRWLTGRREVGILAMEEYLDKGTYDNTNDIVAGLSRQYDIGGYFFRFPNRDHDVVGFGDASTTPERFKEVMRSMNLPVSKLRGAYIYLSNDYPLRDNVILIGDAGGFANRITCEGLYDAFITAENAWRSVTDSKPFRDTNSRMFRKMKREDFAARLFFSSTCLLTIRFIARHWPGLIKYIFDYKMRR